MGYILVGAYRFVVRLPGIIIMHVFSYAVVTVLVYITGVNTEPVRGAHRCFNQDQNLNVYVKYIGEGGNSCK